jgi:hypothetical protein
LRPADDKEVEETLISGFRDGLGIEYLKGSLTQLSHIKAMCRSPENTFSYVRFLDLAGS